MKNILAPKWGTSARRFTIATVLLSASCTAIAACAQTEPADDETPARTDPLAIMASDPDLQWGPCPDVFATGCELTVLNGDPAKPNSDLFLRTPGEGYVLAPHTHTSAERMILVSGELLVHYKGHEPATLQEGDYAFGPAELPHEATCISEDACVLFIAFEQPVDAIPYADAID